MNGDDVVKGLKFLTFVSAALFPVHQEVPS